MKKLDIILFTVLFAAVAFLFFLQFSGKKVKGSTKETSQAQVQSQGVAFVNIDSVIFKFDMFFDRRADLMEKQKKAEAEFNSKENQLKRNAADAQEKVNKGLVTRAQATEMEQSLYQQQQELLALQQKLQADLLEEEQVMNRQIVDYITTYLEENKSLYNYQFILGRSFGSPILYGDPGLDITRQVLDALNVKYKEEKK
jgi:outer membrane protein